MRRARRRTRPTGARRTPIRAPARSVRAPTRVRGVDVAVADLLIIVPATLAGIGGVLLGDRAGLWLKTALEGRKRD